MAAEPKVRYLAKASSGLSADKVGFAYENYFDATIKAKLEIILTAVEHVLSLEDGKNRYISEVTALSKAFAIALPHEEAMDAKDEIAFSQAVKARIQKFDIGATSGGKSDYEIETAIKQVVDEAIVSKQVVDIFDAAGIKKPELSVLDDEFLEEMRNMKHKNLALEVLKKLLNDEIKVRSKHNVVQSRTPCVNTAIHPTCKNSQPKLFCNKQKLWRIFGMGREHWNLERKI